MYSQSHEAVCGRPLQIQVPLLTMGTKISGWAPSVRGVWRRFKRFIYSVAKLGGGDGTVGQCWLYDANFHCQYLACFGQKMGNFVYALNWRWWLKSKPKLRNIYIISKSLSSPSPPPPPHTSPHPTPPAFSSQEYCQAERCTSSTQRAAVSLVRVAWLSENSRLL